MLNIVVPIGFIIFTSVFLASAQTIPDAGKWDIVGARAVPQWLLIVMLVLSIVLLIEGIINWRKKKAASKDTEGVSIHTWFTKYKDIILVYAVLFLWICAFNFLGFFVGAFFLMFFLQWWLEDRKFRIHQILCPLGAVAVCYFIFAKMLVVAFPMGFLEYIL